MAAYYPDVMEGVLLGTTLIDSPPGQPTPSGVPANELPRIPKRVTFATDTLCIDPAGTVSWEVVSDAPSGLDAEAKRERLEERRLLGREDGTARDRRHNPTYLRLANLGRLNPSLPKLPPPPRVKRFPPPREVRLAQGRDWLCINDNPGPPRIKFMGETMDLAEWYRRREKGWYPWDD